MVVMQRYLTQHIQEDLNTKIILLTGPRQTGKTTLAKMLKNDYDFDYEYPGSTGNPVLAASMFARTSHRSFPGFPACPFTHLKST